MSTPPARFALPIPPRLPRALRGGDVPRRAPADPDGPLEIAFLFGRPTVPSDRSSAEGAAAALLPRLEDRGHHVTRWTTDGLSGWNGADVVVACGWTTVPSALRVPDVAVRAVLMLEHEPDRLALSAEREWALWTLAQELPALCGSPWLADQVAHRYGAPATVFAPGLDHNVYRSLPTHRRADLVLLHADAGDAQRATALGLLALEELHARRPDVELALFGDDRELATRFPHRHLGALSPEGRAHAFSEAAVGLSLSLGVPAPTTFEMLACGLPVVELDQVAGGRDLADAPALLAPLRPDAIASAVELLLDDLSDRAERSRAGIEAVAGRSWETAATDVDAGLREALHAGLEA